MQKWFDFLETLEKDFGKNTVSKWLYNFKVLKYDARNLYLQAQDTFYLNWFTEHIKPRLKNEFINNNGLPIKVHINLKNQLPKKEIKKEEKKFIFEIKSDQINKDYTLKNFYLSKNNSISYKLLSELIGYDYEDDKIIDPKLKKASFNPIFIYGKSGSGKTHLLHACANILKKQNLNVFFAKGQTFTNHFVKAIKNGNMHKFRSTYRNIDALIVDDIDVFSNKNATQEEFFHTFNTLHNASAQIILSAKTPPSQISNIEPRLLSRFDWGISLSFTMPSNENLRKIILSKTKIYNLIINNDAIDFLINTFKSNIKSISKAIDAIVLRFHLSHNSSNIITVSEIKANISDLIQEEKKHSLSSDRIVKIIASHFGIKTDDILGKSQTKECTLPRQFSMYFCRDKLKLPYMSIGQYFKRDHSTVMTSVKFIDRNIESKQGELYYSYIEIQKEFEKI
jgi:chromosomal replication initiator protein